MLSKSGTGNSWIITESTVHYIAALLDREADRYPSKHHQDALKEIRELSNRLLESLEKPVSVAISRHRLER